MKTDGKIVAGGLTQAQINEYKAKSPNKKVHLITLDAKEDKPEQHFWFITPKMNTMSAVAAVSGKNPMQGMIVMFKNCLVHGDKTACEDVDLFSNISSQLESIIEDRTTSIKKF